MLPVVLSTVSVCPGHKEQAEKEIVLVSGHQWSMKIYTDKMLFFKLSTFQSSFYGWLAEPVLMIMVRDIGYDTVSDKIHHLRYPQFHYHLQLYFQIYIQIFSIGELAKPCKSFIASQYLIPK